MAGRAASPILEPTEHDLDAIAPLVTEFIVFDGCFALHSAGGSGAYPFVLQRFPEPGSVITSIPEQPFDLWQAAEQRPCADIVAHLSGGDEQVDGPSPTVAVGMLFGVHASRYLGRAIWGKWSGYHRRSRVETKMHCMGTPPIFNGAQP